MRATHLRPGQAYHLRPDVQLHAPADLLGRKAALDFQEGDLILSCPNIRARSKVLSTTVSRLLLHFRDGSTVTDAIITLARERGMEAEPLLEKYFPVLEDLYQWGYLCSEDELPGPPPDDGGLPESLPGYLTQRLLKKSSSILVVRALSPGGRTVCVKRLLDHDDSAERAKIVNEAAILALLCGAPVPDLIEHDPGQKECPLVSSWAGDTSSREAFSGAIGAEIVVRTSVALKFALSIIRCFAEIHSRGVLHSDVHYNNVRFNQQGDCRIIDFGLAFVSGAPDAARPLEEAVFQFLAPEQLPGPGELYRRPSWASEQYSIAALLHYLLSGDHYLDFHLETDLAISQIRSESPRPLVLRNGEMLPEIGGVLGRALGKNPADRHASVADFANAFEKAMPAAEKLEVTTGIKSGGGSEASFALLDPDRAVRCNGPDFGISGSLNLALAALALASAKMEPGYLDSALIWASHARHQRGQPEQYRAEISRSAKSSVPLFIGTACLHALPVAMDLALLAVDHSTGFRERFDDNLAERIDSLVAHDDQWDLTTGHACLLNIFCHFVRSGFTDERLHQWGDRLFLSLTARLAAPPLLNVARLPEAGIAHGVAGIWYVLTQWADLAKTPGLDLEGDFNRFWSDARLQEIIRSARNSPFASWWCNGLSGLIFLLRARGTVLASGHLQERLQEMIELVARHPPTVAHICCGRAASTMAFSQTAFLLQDPNYLPLARKAAREIEKCPDDQPEDISILKGQLGIALVLEAIEQRGIYVPFLGVL